MSTRTRHVWICFIVLGPSSTVKGVFSTEKGADDYCYEQNTLTRTSSPNNTPKPYYFWERHELLRS